MTRRKLLKKVNKWSRQLRRTNVKSMYTFWMIALIVGFLLFSSVVILAIYEGGAYLLKLVPNGNENWAVAMIAFPVAMFGVYLPLHISKVQKYSKCFAGSTLISIHKKGLHFLDFENLLWNKLVLDFVLWLSAYFSSNYGEMIGHSLVMVIEILVLILLTLRKYNRTPSDIYVKNVMSLYFDIIADKHTEQNSYTEIKPFLKSGESEKFSEILSTNYSGFWNELSQLALSIISNPNNEEEKLAFFQISKKIRDLEFKETNACILWIFVDFSIKLCHVSIEKNDYHFASLLVDDMMASCTSYFTKYTDELNRYKKDIIDILEHKDLFTSKERTKICTVMESYKERFDILLEILMLFNAKLEEIIALREQNKVLNEFRMQTFAGNELVARAKTIQSIMKDVSDLLGKLKEILLQ